MARIDVSETIKLIDFPEKVWEWLDLFGDIVAATQLEAIYQDRDFIADTPFKKIFLCTINKDLSTLNTIFFILRCELIHQAASHVRLFCESLITMKYISLYPTERSELFWGYSDIEGYRVTSSILEWERGRAKAVHVKKVEKIFEAIKEKYEAAKPKYSFIDKNNKRKPFINWCNKSVSKQAAECGTEFQRLYDLVYKQMSTYIHGSAWSLRRQISYSRAHYNSDIVLIDIATIIRTALAIWVEWAKFCVLTFGWRFQKTMLDLPKRIEELDERHFQQI